MPSRKQRRRQMKEKRHAYEFVYVDADGNELDELPEGFEEETKERDKVSRNGSKPEPKKPQRPQRGSGRVPPAPSWNRAAKRGALLGIVVFALFAFTAKGSYVKVVPLAIVYTILFIPFTYVIDRFAYNRYQQRQGGGSATAKKKR
ncbi:MAG TPA: hypothetical protein VGN27_08565 [Gaiellaceae bacterium]|jgi:hypothetical protein|nr:hypothetical protein [Gaiellaceae bacterium]